MTDRYVPPLRRKGLSGKSSHSSKDDDRIKQRQARFFSDTKLSAKGAPSYGFVSRGEDDRLQKDEDARRELLGDVTNRLMELVVDHPQLEVPALFDGIELESSYDDTSRTKSSRSIDSVLSDLRKLREASLHLESCGLSKLVFLLSVRVGCLMKRYETMVPAAAFIMAHEELVTKEEMREVASYYTLYLCHHLNASSLAIREFFAYLEYDQSIKEILHAWIREDYVSWFLLFKTQHDPYIKQLMDSGKKVMAGHMIKVFSKSFFAYPVSSVETLLECKLESLGETYGIPWPQTNGYFTVRKR